MPFNCFANLDFWINDLDCHLDLLFDFSSWISTAPLPQPARFVVAPVARELVAINLTLIQFVYDVEV